MLIKQSSILLPVSISKGDIEKLLHGVKLTAQVNDGEYVVTIVLEDK